MPDYVRMYLVIALGLASAILVQKRTGRFGASISLLSVLAADSDLYWMQVFVVFALRAAGWWTASLARSVFWHGLWAFLPVLMLALAAWGLVRDAKRERTAGTV